MTETRDVPLPPPTSAAALRKVTRGGPIPRLDTYWKVEAIVRRAHEREEDPITFEEIKRRLGAKSVRHSTVRACVSEMERQGNVVVTPSGILWCPTTEAALSYERSRSWVRL